MLLRNGGRQGVLLCCRDDIWETARDRKSLLPILATSLGLHELEPVRQPYFRILRELCQAMIRYSDIKFFWKDRKRRFAGVSQAFLDYYGLKDEKASSGKPMRILAGISRGKSMKRPNGLSLKKARSRTVLSENVSSKATASNCRYQISYLSRETYYRIAGVF